MSSTDVTDQQLPRGAGSAGEPVAPVPASSTIVLRRGTFEVLLLKRTDRSTFVPGSWVFPGGALEPDDRELDGESELGSMRICAARELLEEAGIWIGRPLDSENEARAALLEGRSGIKALVARDHQTLEELVLTSRWVTPEGVPKRFDTWFFLLAVPDATFASAEQREVTEVLWITPSDALQRHKEGNLPMVFPTMKNLEAIATFSSAADLIQARRHADIRSTRPVLIVEEGRKRIVLPEPHS